MALSREQYDSIMRGYAQSRDRNRRLRQERRDSVYLHVPEIRRLDEQVPETAASRLRMRLSGSGDEASRKAQEAAQQQLLDLQSRRAALLKENGYSEDYLDLTYDCPICKDTGYVNGEKCICFRRKEIALLYDQSHLQVQLPEAGFDKLLERYYQGSDLENFRRSREAAVSFIRTFDDPQELGLLLYGTTGAGKTFLSVCIAGELLKRGRSVLYFSAATLFDRLSGYSYDARGRDDFRVFTEDLYSCDLLIIDDLGTELTNQFVSSQLFACLSERILRKKGTVISTNLSLQEFQKRYSDRTFSRVTYHYRLCKMTGSDIRVLKRREAQTARRAAGT